MKAVSLFFLFVYVAHAARTSYPFGTALSENRHVTAFSNAGNLTMTSESNFIGEMYSGVKWQNVEYARRWLITIKNVTLDSVDKAADIWDLESWTSVEGALGSGPVPITHYTNGGTFVFPSEGSLIIWPTGPEIGQYGHVAVITGVGADVVYVTEQNYDNTVQWIGTRDYSRSLPVLKLPSGHFQIQSPEPIYGWVTLDTPAPDELPPNNAQINVIFFVGFSISFFFSIIGFALFSKMVEVGESIQKSNLQEMYAYQDIRFQEVPWIDEQEEEMASTLTSRRGSSSQGETQQDDQSQVGV